MNINRSTNSRTAGQASEGMHAPDSQRRPSSGRPLHSFSTGSALQSLLSRTERSARDDSRTTSSHSGKEVASSSGLYESSEAAHIRRRTATADGSLTDEGTETASTRTAETEVARFEALKRELGPQMWSAMLSEVDMSLLPPDLSAQKTHAELKAERAAERKANKADKDGAAPRRAATKAKQEELLRRIESKRTSDRKPTE